MLPGARGGRTCLLMKCRFLTRRVAMSSSRGHVSYGVASGRTEGPQASPSLRVTLPCGPARDTGPIPFANWRVARNLTLAAILAGQDRLMVTGPPGVGKSLLLHDVARVLRSAGWDAAVQLRPQCVLDDATSTGKPRAVLVDEADRLSATELQSVRDTACHAVVLAGLDSLDGRCPGWTRVTLALLTPAECTAFTGLWLAQAGYPSTLLSEDAAVRAADLSRGVPRLLANLLNGAVWLAVSERAVLVSRAHVEESAGFRDCLDLSDKPAEDAAPGGVTGCGAAVTGCGAPRRGLADSVAQNRVYAAPAAVPLPPPAWAASAQLAVQEAQDGSILVPSVAAARSGNRQARPRTLAFAMAGIVCIAAGAVGTGWLFFGPNAAATVSLTASRSGPRPVPPASRPVIAGAELAASTPAPSERVQLAALAATGELRVSDAAWHSTVDVDDADQRMVLAASNVDASLPGDGLHQLVALEVPASTDPVPEPAAPNPARLSVPQTSELEPIPSVSTHSAEETSAPVSPTTDSPVPVTLQPEPEPSKEPPAAVEQALPVVEPAPAIVPAATDPASPPEAPLPASSSASDEVRQPVMPSTSAERASAPPQEDTASVTPGAASPAPEPPPPPIDAVPPVVAPALTGGAAPPPAPSLSPATLALLVQRGHQLIAVGDVSGARLLYGRAAASGSAIAALSMGRTFDPVFLQQIGARIAPSAAVAADWYQRAAALGSPDAAALLQQPNGPGLKQSGPKQTRSVQ